jgi:hypothetical protein
LANFDRHGFTGGSTCIRIVDWAVPTKFFRRTKPINVAAYDEGRTAGKRRFSLRSFDLEEGRERESAGGGPFPYMR